MKIKLFLDKLFKKPKPVEMTQEQKLGIMLEDLCQLFIVIDEILKNKLSRTARKQFWRDFYKSGSLRKDVFEELLKTKTISDRLLNEYISIKGVNYGNKS